MYNSLLIVIILSFFINSCSFKNPLSKNSQVVYVDCPKTLILAPASKIIEEGASLNLNKNYTMTCYSPNLDSTDVFFDFNYLIELSHNDDANLYRDFDFIVFITNKSENEKIYEQSFIQNIEIEKSSDEKLKKYESTHSFSNQLIIDKSTYTKGIKVFIGIL